MTVGINEFVVINQDETARLMAQEYVNNYGEGKLLVRKEKSQNPWELGITMTDTGVAYSFQAPT
ncbi:hypothetical protein C1X73_35855, partial [Pseudomonas sp. FW305-130]